MTAGCVLIGLFALYQVFFPLAQGNQVSLILFLAAVLPLSLLCYRSGVRLRRDKTEAPQAQRDNPTPVDWLLAVVALVACLYPVLPFQMADGGGGFDEFLSRQGSPGMADVIVGSIVLLLVLE
ncbi:MAG TPA: C4-dicarboxylate ABC transporter permease, partial [Mycobacterium sp.]|nr:C4-dicarboxylate ABC transporter permease [Mycobacterium sp.]